MLFIRTNRMKTEQFMRLNTQCPLKLLFSLEECQNAILWFPIEILNTFVFYCVQLSLKLAELLQVFYLRKFPVAKIMLNNFTTRPINQNKILSVIL